ncbi:cysteine-rich venom protein Cau1-like [Chrysoperla carnea]|uniref:cysteine-rich venom protein Cau1-like n=1 Tax=Chrysoperla carnea TaxID=189513 RepID=UPI001D06D149|nr:cysteine-rich venom protein Cau1-like [Chrysoperla carnea]
MIGLKWSEEAREFAEKSANTCIKGHSAGEDRQSDMFGPCGENLFFSWSSGQYKYTWFDAIEAWHSEKKDFTYGSKDYEFMAIGHYTAVMWASTSHIGCAYKNCDTPLEKRKPNWVQNKFACIYCTSGNYLDKIHMPYKRGKPCTDCPNDCFKSLCLNKCPLKNKLPEKYCKKDTGILFKKNKKGCNDVNVREKCPSTCDCSDRPYIQRWSQ